MKEDKRLKRRVRNSYLAATVSIMLVLFLLGSVGYLMAVATQVAQRLQSGVEITVELRNDRTEADTRGIEGALTASELVHAWQLLTKQQKADDALFKEIFESEFEEVLGENPLLDSYEVTLTAASADRAEVEALMKRLEALPGVDRVTYPMLMAEQLHATVQKIRLVLLLFGGALLIVSLILLSNTIRLSIYAKRYLINTMKLVGATRWFIMRPFLWSSLTQGFWAGLGASLFFAAALYGLNEAVPELLTLAHWEEMAVVVGAMIVGGISLATLFAALALNKFINMKSNKIHLY